MTAIPTTRWSLVGGTAAFVLILDQLTKAWALQALGDGEVIPVFWTLRFLLAENYGAAFSMGSGTGWVRFLPLIVLGVVALVVWRTRSELTRAGALAVGMIIGGAVGNLIDRAVRSDGGGLLSGGVVDFIDFQWWPVFNVADIGVVCGGILFALVALRQPVEDPDPGSHVPTAGTTGSSDGEPPSDPPVSVAEASGPVGSGRSRADGGR